MTARGARHGPSTWQSITSRLPSLGWGSFALGQPMARRVIDETEQLSRRRVAGRAEVVVERDMILALGGVRLRPHAGVAERLHEPDRLGFRLRMLGDMQHEHRRDSLASGDVG